MIETVLAFLSSGPIGALIGGVLGVMNRRNDIELKRLDVGLERDRFAHQQAMRAVDLQQTQAEAEGKRAVAVLEGEAASEAARLAAVASAQAADRVSGDQLREAGWFGRFILILTTFIQALVRPVLTTGLVGVALWLGLELLWMLRAHGWNELQAAERKDLALQSLAWVFAQASACVQYWMVSRGTGK